jgi:transcriptional regulator with XRE-family HTH domain
MLCVASKKAVKPERKRLVKIDMAGIAARLRKARKDAGAAEGLPGSLPQRVLAERAGVADSQIDQIEKERIDDTNIGTLASIAHALGKSFHWMMTGDGEEASHTDLGRYPNRIAARTLVAGHVSPEAIDRVMSSSFEFPRDLTEGEWVDEFKRMDRMLEQPGRTLTVVDDPRPPAGRRGEVRGR